MTIIYSLFLSCWRACFGNDGWNIPILENRFVQHVIGFSAAVGILWWNDDHWIQCVLAALVLQGLYWARSHGCCFDFGHSYPPSLDRYEQLWYWKYVKKIIPEAEWYKFAGDYILMTVRYTLPAMLIGIILLNTYACFAGVVLASVYAFMWKLADWWGVKNPTKISEWVVGFTTGLLIGG